MNIFSLQRQAQHILNDMAKIPGSLGTLEDLALQLVTIQKRLTISINQPTLVLACADHQLITEGVSASTSLITYQQVRNFQSGGGACALLSKENHVALNIYNVGMQDSCDPSWNVENKFFIRKSDGNPLMGPALSRDEAIEAINNGKEAIKERAQSGCNTIILGEMGVGNTTTSSLLSSSLLQKPAQECVNRALCATSTVYKNKIHLIEKAKELHEKDITDIYDTLSCYGGLEIAFLAGAILQSKKEHMVVLIDGFITTVALFIAYHIDPCCLENCIACTRSGETTQSLILSELHMVPLLDLHLSLGEGTGALTALSLVKESCALFTKLGSCYNDQVTNVHPHLFLPFPLGTTSYILPASIPTNLEYLRTLPEVEDIELVFFESRFDDSIPDAETLQKLAETAEKYHLSYTVHLPYDVDIASFDNAQREAAIQTWITFIMITKELPIHGYVAHLHYADQTSQDTPFIIEQNTKDHHTQRAESLILIQESIEKILKTTGIDPDLFCIETLEQDPQVLLPLIQQLHLSIALDIGHMVRFHTATKENLEALLPFTRIIHLHGVEGGKDHQSLKANTDYDISSFLALLQKYNYQDIVVTLEVFQKEKLLDSIHYLTEPREESHA